MKSKYEPFFENTHYAIVGFTRKKPFPILTYRALKRGCTVFPIDPTISSIDGNETYKDFESLPLSVEAAILELPADQTEEWVERAGRAGIRDLWIHMKTDTPQALQKATDLGMNVFHGTCAVMYANKGFSFHSIHKWINKALGSY